MPENTLAIIQQFEHLSKECQQTLKDHPDFVEASSIYEQLQNIHVKLVEFENERIETIIKIGLKK